MKVQTVAAIVAAYGALLASAVVAESEHELLNYEEHDCVLRRGSAEEIASYKSVVDKIVNAYAYIEQFISRIHEPNIQDHCTEYMINVMQQEGIKDIVTEYFNISNWNRKEESVTMIKPRYKPIGVLGSIKSIRTLEHGIVAEVAIVSSNDEFYSLQEDTMRNKILLLDVYLQSDEETAKYIRDIALTAAENGAVAFLIRSPSFPISTQYTGCQSYEIGPTAIPSLAVTHEHTELLKKLCKRGEKVILNVKVLSTFETKQVRNILIDSKGRKMHKLVIVSSHGGSGALVGWGVPIVLERLRLRPRRTVRSILWAAEEKGLVGAYNYARKHCNEMVDINFIMEISSPTLSPRGLGVSGTRKTRCIVAHVLKLFKAINATRLAYEQQPGSGVTANGVPRVSMLNRKELEYWYPETKMNNMNVDGLDEFDTGLAFWTAVAYIIADISIDLPQY